ncbi:MAG: C4-dicarboxylate ABC transporter permease [Betaproteobacteria bacterium RIFCSPLOWO2_12_FULL_65_14]|nr:MAG: C4-dicarboxylate ABC transporter permease [Betaproteobacteria bacterium RIFCSPLOWO2_12_FULL_65_14]
MAVLVAVLLALVFSGVHIAVALGCAAMLGIYLMTGDFQVVANFVGSTAYEAVRDYVFAVIPLFMLMGEFLAKCGAATDLFSLFNRLTRIVPGRLAVATVISNAVFAFVTGVSIAAAAAFSRIAYPEMKRHGYQDRFALGCIAGSACLGMLIPPSVLMIVWAILTEMSIGDLFLAGVLPGLLLTALYVLYIVAAAGLRPALAGGKRESPSEEPHILQALLSTSLVIALVAGTLGGIWFGAFTPTEGAGVGAAAALVLALAKGVRAREIGEVILAVGRTSAPLLLLLVTAQLYSRVLTMTGFTRAAQELLLGTGLGAGGVLLLMVLVWFLLGCIIDSISILLLTVPIFYPIAKAIGLDPLAFAVIGIVAVETGLLTPPFGLLVFTVKAAIHDPAISVGKIFAGSMPYWVALLAVIVCLWQFPQIATYLPGLLRT